MGASTTKEHGSNSPAIKELKENTGNVSNVVFAIDQSGVTEDPDVTIPVNPFGLIITGVSRIGVGVYQVTFDASTPVDWTTVFWGGVCIEANGTANQSLVYDRDIGGGGLMTLSIESISSTVLELKHVDYNGAMADLYNATAGYNIVPLKLLFQIYR